jgi:hypothetical protein
MMAEGKQGWLNVTRDTVQRSLREISDDPSRISLEEIDWLKAQNPEVLKFTSARGTALRMHLGPIPSSYWTEGAFWGHRIIRNQVEAAGRQLPRVNEDQLLSYMQGQFNDFGVNPTTISGGLGQKTLDVFVREPGLAEGFDKLTRYRIDRVVLCGGAAEIYELYEHAIETEQLRSWFRE